jgi:hypothetical protein
MYRPRLSFACALFTTLLSVGTFITVPAPARAAPLPSDLNLQPNDVRKVLVGQAALTLRVVEIGASGWVNVEIMEDASCFGLKKSERHWLNVNQALLIQSAQAPH